MTVEPNFTYYALISDVGKPGGLLRRSHDGLGRKGESLRGDFTWQPSEFLERYDLGHNDSDFTEVSADEAASLIEQWRSQEA